MINIPKPELTEIKQLRVDNHNPNFMSDSQLEALKKNIQKYGFIVPVITNKELVVADGEHRIKAAEAIGMSHVPVVRLDVDVVDRKLLRQALNKLKGVHDADLDAEEYLRIREGMSSEEISSFLALSAETFEIPQETNPVVVRDVEPESVEGIKTDIKKGDIIKLGQHLLMCGDATNPENVGLLMIDKKADLLLTDPPYGIDIVKTKSSISETNFSVGFNNKSSNRNSQGSIGGSGIVPVGTHLKIIGDDKPFSPEFLLKYGNKQIIWGGNYFANKLPNSSCWIIWDKRGEIPSNNFADCEIAWTNMKKPSRVHTHKWNGLIREGKRESELPKRVHPTQKPVGLHATLLVDYSDEYHLVLDLFGGSGTTLIACEQLNRVCRMMELSPEYCEVICRRWEKLTGKQREII